MALEIERKFLVTSDAYKSQAISEKRITQGFLNTHPDRTVRVRVKGNLGLITVKGKSNEAGTTRFEWEHTITVEEAKSLLKLCEEGVIEKTRFEIKHGKHTFEVDEFLGKNTGLIIAEVELSEENETFTKPLWLGKEVTGETRYYNSSLSKNPFESW